MDRISKGAQEKRFRKKKKSRAKQRSNVTRVPKKLFSFFFFSLFFSSSPYSLVRTAENRAVKHSWFSYWIKGKES